MMPMQTPLLSQSPKSTSIFCVMRDPASLLAGSLQHLHGDVVVAGDVLHVDPLQAIEIDLVARHEVEQVLDRDHTFQACQRRPEAAVNSIAQPHMWRLGAIACDVELFGPIVCTWIPVG